MGTTFVIVQHAEKEAQPGDPGLTPVGVRQATAAARALLSLAPVATYSSPLRRAAETAARIAAELGQRVVEDAALRERMNWSDDTGLTLEEFLAEWQAASRDRDYQPPCGDSSSQAGARFEMALQRLAEVHGHATVVCVSHGGVTTDLLRTIIGDEQLRALAPDIIDNGVPGGALTTVRRELGAWLVDGVAAIAHIAEADRTGHKPT